jgi:hypothetical protein
MSWERRYELGKELRRRRRVRIRVRIRMKGWVREKA